ncbi:MAG: hypothetical protein IJZ52_05635 [Clostridium sp.]|nr:hypothetical protein [Clostridium sp.]
MYNRYIPDRQPYAPVGEGETIHPAPQRVGSASLLGKGTAQLSELLKKLHLEKLDSGDLLLLLIVLLLWKEEEDMDLLLALGAALLLGEDT